MEQPIAEERRFVMGFLWGVVATIVMSLLMIVGLATGMSPMPKPIPAAIMGKLLGPSVPRPALMTLAVVAHLGYGGFWGGVLARVARPVTIVKGVLLGLLLWLGMQLLVLPFLGWGAFGSQVTPRIAMATFVLHLVYGLSLGWLVDRREASVRPRTG
jgi:hypothetical protein